MFCVFTSVSYSFTVDIFSPDQFIPEVRQIIIDVSDESIGFHLENGSLAP